MSAYRTIGAILTAAKYVVAVAIGVAVGAFLLTLVTDEKMPGVGAYLVSVATICAGIAIGTRMGRRTRAPRATNSSP
jgi:hypothetical protein